MQHTRYHVDHLYTFQEACEVLSIAISFSFFILFPSKNNKKKLTIISMLNMRPTYESGITSE
jgi:hypothetical protein